jgi:predicted membrane protein
MLGSLLKVIGLALVAWFTFVIGAAVFAAMKRREAGPVDPAADEVDLVANFGPLEFHSESASFRGGSVTTMFGGGEVDLRDATLDPAGATLHVSTLFGGGSLVVPEGWNIETKLTGLGGVGDMRPKVERGIDAPTLRLEGSNWFGGWGITSTKQGEDNELPELVTV